MVGNLAVGVVGEEGDLGTHATEAQDLIGLGRNEHKHIGIVDQRLGCQVQAYGVDARRGCGI